MNGGGMAQTLADRLATVAASGQAITFSAVGLPPSDVDSEAAAVAAGPCAPLLAEAIARAFSDGIDATWHEAAGRFPEGLADQRSLLALTSALETLLSAPAAAQKLGRPLSRVLLEDLSEAVQQMPLLAAARLEGAIRLAVAQMVSPYQVWEALEELTTDAPEDFLEHLPRILGVALDCWAQRETAITASVRGLLEQLSHTEAADVDALFELGCDQLRSALTAADLAEVSRFLTQARRYFAAAAAAEDARDDARAYTAACDAVLGFAAGNASQVTAAAERLEQALERHVAWLHGTHQPAWLRPRQSADVAWGRLVLQLREAAQQLQAPVWMEPWQALDAVLAAHRAARTMRPVGADQNSAAGLVTLVEPAIEDRFLREQNFLAILRHAAAHPQDHPAGGFDAATATAVLTRIEARESSAPTENSVGAGEDDEEAGSSERLYRIAPTVMATLGLDRARHVAAGLDDTALADVEGIAYTNDVARLKASDPLIIPLLDRILGELGQHPGFTGNVRTTFGALVETTLLFLKSRSDLTRSSLHGSGKKDDPPYDYRRKPEKGQRTAVEADLQRDFHGWLMGSPLHSVVQVEPINVEMGRADVMVHFGSLRYLTEIKQDANDNSRLHIEDQYLAQAAQYTNTGAPFGQLLVLDLTPKTTTSGTLRIDELTWTTTHRPDGATTDRCVVAGIVTGNRITPSAYSR